MIRKKTTGEEDSMDLFEYVKEKNLEKESPLASRMRPDTLEEVVGQQHIIGPGKTSVPGSEGGQAQLP